MNSGKQVVAIEVVTHSSRLNSVAIKHQALFEEIVQVKNTYILMLNSGWSQGMFCVCISKHSYRKITGFWHHTKHCDEITVLLYVWCCR